MVIFFKKNVSKLLTLEEENKTLKEQIKVLEGNLEETNKKVDKKVEELKTYIINEFEAIKQGLNHNKEEMLKKAEESKAIFKEWLIGEEKSN